MKDKTVNIAMAGVRCNAARVSVAYSNGIYFGQRDDDVVVAIVQDGEAVIVRLSEDMVDKVGHAFAEAVERANRHGAPSLETVQ